MQYDDFLALVKAGVSERCPNSEVVIDKVIKNNSVELDGLSIRSEGKNVFPTIYLNSFYEEFEGGVGLDEIIDNILRINSRNVQSIDIDAEELTDLEKGRENIYFKVISTDRNRILLGMVPHREILDLSIVYYYKIYAEGIGSGSVLIYNSHIKNWEISEDELFDIAYENTVRNDDFRLVPMNSLLKELMGGGELPFELEDACDSDKMMHVLTTNNGVFGAAGIVRDDILKRFAETHGAFYVIPSSIHDLILLPDDPSYEAEAILGTIAEVNKEQVDPMEVLSDNLYYYDPDCVPHLSMFKCTA